MCLRFQFCTHQRVCILYFLKKGKFVVPYCTYCIYMSLNPMCSYRIFLSGHVKDYGMNYGIACGRAFRMKKNHFVFFSLSYSSWVGLHRNISDLPIRHDWIPGCHSFFHTSSSYPHATSSYSHTSR